MNRQEQTMQLTSPAFTPMAEIPRKYTCDGADLSPPLAWADVPAGTQSLVLVVHDPDVPSPDAPKRIWVHWVMYNLPADCAGLAEAVAELPAGTQPGLNDWNRIGYGGPCPPKGRHRYFHALYALDCVLPDLKRPTKAALEQAMQGHVLARAELVGTYIRV
jgi:Raf kinase inhibitor-like YbhB/YbcL family protein